METSPVLVAELGAADAVVVGAIWEADVGAVPRLDSQDKQDLPPLQAAKTGTTRISERNEGVRVLVKFCSRNPVVAIIVRLRRWPLLELESTV